MPKMQALKYLHILQSGVMQQILNIICSKDGKWINMDVITEQNQIENEKQAWLKLGFNPALEDCMAIIS